MYKAKPRKWNRDYNDSKIHNEKVSVTIVISRDIFSLNVDFSNEKMLATKG